MKRIAVILLSICTLSSAFCRAESAAITHDFDKMKGTMTFLSDNKVGVTSEVTYTCMGNGVFTNVADKGVIIGIRLSNNDSVQTSPAVENLKRLQLLHNKGSVPSGVKIYTSTDNSTWTDISSSATCSKSDIDVPITKGNYYIKVVNKTGAVINFLSFSYIYDPCHCLRVVSE